MRLQLAADLAEELNRSQLASLPTFWVSMWIVPKALVKPGDRAGVTIKLLAKSSTTF